MSPPILLRPFTEADVPFIAALASDERVTRFVGDGRPWDSPTIDARCAAALADLPVEQVGSVRWFIAVEEPATTGSAPAPVGLVAATHQSAGVEVGYWVAPRTWGRGVAGRMLSAAAAVVPEVFGVTRLFARVDPANLASVRVLERHGFAPVPSPDALLRYELR